MKIQQPHFFDAVSEAVRDSKSLTSEQYQELKSCIPQMQKFGGGFVKALAELIQHADFVNMFIIYHTYPHYWSLYTPKNWK